MANASMLLGASTEHLIVSMLLKEERELYLPAVDDHGVDILVKSKKHGKVNTYQELQIKSLSKKGLFAAIKCPNPQRNYWFVFYVRQHETIWLINSLEFVKIASVVTKNTNNFGKYSLSLATLKGIRKEMKKYVVKDFSRLP